MTVQGCVAFDIGAESGRAMLGTLNGGRLDLKEIHRFPNRPLRLPNGLHWNLLDLWQQLMEGLRRCGRVARDAGIDLVSLGVDTWGVDYGLVGSSGQLLGLPFAYRDARNQPAMDKTLRQLGPETIYRTTGIQFMPCNTLFQLVAHQESEPGLLQQAQHLLMMPDLLHYFFTGEMFNEATNASTTQMVDPHSGQWALDLVERLGLPTRMLGRIVPASTVIGHLCPHVAQQADVGLLQVIAPPSHDTASAVAAVPADGSQSWAYLSSGTWSLLGCELEAPLVNEATRLANFTNEGGVEGRIRFLKNIPGMWLLQECRRELAEAGKPYSYGELTDLASRAEDFRTLVDPFHEPFASPGGMLAKIAAFADGSGQPRPETPGQFTRCCLESLALAYRQTLKTLEGLVGCTIDVLYIVGGGARNAPLNQMTADSIGRPVMVGPYEATAIGNALVQAIGFGQIKDLSHIRQVVGASFEPVTLQPKDCAAFERQFDRYAELCR